jgi:hypothetical protein
MAELSSIALLPGNTDHQSADGAALVISSLNREDFAAASRRIWSTRFVIEKIPQIQAVDIMGQLIEQKLAVIAVPSRGVLPLPRRTLLSGISLVEDDFILTSRGSQSIINVRDFLHAHVGRLSVRGSRRILTKAGRELRVETDITVVDLYFRGGAAFRLDLNKVSFADDPVLANLPRRDAAASFLWELAKRAQEVRRPILPASLPLIEGLNSPYWATAQVPNLNIFDNWGRWWFALAANKHLPSPIRLDEILLSTTPTPSRRTPSSNTRIAPAMTPPRGTATFRRPDQTPPSAPPISPSKSAVLRPPTTRLTIRNIGRHGERGRTPPPRSIPAILPSPDVLYENLMREAAEVENQGQIEVAAVKYKQALKNKDTFEARLALVETLVDAKPFEAWYVCEECVERYPEQSQILVDEYKGVHRENYDCHDFLTYRALRRFLRKAEILKTVGYDPMRRFFTFHELSNKLPDATKGGLLDAYGEELNFQFPAAHRRLISSYNGLDLYSRAFRFLGVGGEDEAFDLFLFNDQYGWRRFYDPNMDSLVGFGYDYLGNVFLYDPREILEDPPIVRLDADTGEIEPIASSFDEFIGIDLTDPDEDVVRSRLLREWVKNRSPLKMRECLSFQTSPVLGGEKNFLNLITSELGIRLHMAGQIATQAQQIPEGATIHGVRVINQEELLLKVYWDY